MMKIKSLLLAALAVVATMSVTSCGDDDDEVVLDNYTKYQRAVDAQVNAQKKHDKAILLVAFGSTWQCAFNSFDNTKKAYEQAFPDCDVYVSYSSAICINRAAAGEHAADGADKRNYYAPNFWLHALGAVKYSEITVQSLQVIPGEEYGRVINYIKDFGNNYLGDLDDKYLSEVTVRLGTPLLNSEDDVKDVAKILNDEFKADAATKSVLFMGHGNPSSKEHDYDIYKANVRYEQLETELQKYSANYFVGTVDQNENKKEDVWARIQEQGAFPASKSLVLQALMSIAGDHAHNDMYGEGEEYWDEKEPASEDNSWLEYFKNEAKYENISTRKTQSDDLRGLLDIPEILNVWINHTKNNIELSEVYHSMYPEE